MRRALIYILAIAALTSCTGPRHAMISAPPAAIELEGERRIATVHFPRGIYSLATSDRTGWFYRAPGGVIEHAFGTFVRHDGGIFLPRDGATPRGYMDWAGGRTKLGSISRAELQFR